jgi:tryptophan-rich sensory protein
MTILITVITVIFGGHYGLEYWILIVMGMGIFVLHKKPLLRRISVSLSLLIFVGLRLWILYVPELLPVPHPPTRMLYYVLMAIAAWMAWRRGPVAKPALQLFIVQLALNVAWSFIFFGAHNPGLAFAEIIVLWLAIIATARAFWRLSPPAGLLMLPYIAWVSFAAVLNFTVWRLNA